VKAFEPVEQILPNRSRSALLEVPVQRLHGGPSPLRERSEDIPVLAYHFLRKAEAKVNKKVDRFSQDALDMLRRYSWPGNLRELEKHHRAGCCPVIEPADRRGAPAALPAGVGADPGHHPGRLRAGQGAGRVHVREGGLSPGSCRKPWQYLGRGPEGGITRRNFHRLLSKYSINTKKFKTEL